MTASRLSRYLRTCLRGGSLVGVRGGGTGRSPDADYRNYPSQYGAELEAACRQTSGEAGLMSVLCTSVGPPPGVGKPHRGSGEGPYRLPNRTAV